MAECVTLCPGRAAYHVVVGAGSWCIGASVLLLLLLFAAFAAERRALAGDGSRGAVWLVAVDRCFVAGCCRALLDAVSRDSRAGAVPPDRVRVCVKAYGCGL